MKIKFRRSDIEVESFEKEIPLLEICYQYDTPINFSCRIGMCGTCRVSFSEGIENVSPKNEEELILTREPNERLGCQCTIKGDVTIE